MIAVGFSSDGKQLITGSYDDTARVWSLDSADLIEKACSRLDRNLTKKEWQEYIGDIAEYQATCPDLPIPGQ